VAIVPTKANKTSAVCKQDETRRRSMQTCMRSLFSWLCAI